MEDMIKANTSRLGSDVTDIQGRIEEMEKKLADLKEHSVALNAMCDGLDAQEIKAAMGEDISALESMIKQLRALNEYEEYARTQYDECESKVGDLVSQIRY